jgi:hypothetical protein
MQDHSHKFLFLGVTAVMCAAAVYGSEAGPALLLPADKPISSLEAPFAVPTGTQGGVQAVSFRTSEAPPSQATPQLDEAQQRGAASVMPNSDSCPAADAAALVAPPSVNGAIGSPTPLEKAALPRQGLTGPTLGTGSSCPLAPDGAVQKIAPAADAPHRKPGAALPGVILRP